MVRLTMIDDASEVNLVRKGFLQDDEAKVSSTPVHPSDWSHHSMPALKPKCVLHCG